MLRSGYSGTGLVELLDSAGVPKGSFYNHFDSKEAFGVELIRGYYARHDEVLASLAAQTARPAVERLRSYFEALIDSAGAAAPQLRGCLLGLFALETSGSSEPLRAAVGEAFARWEARIAELLRQAQDAGELDAEQDPRELAALLVESFEGAVMRARVTGDLAGLRRSLDVAFERLLT